MLPYKDKGVVKSRPSAFKSGTTEFVDKKGKVVGYSKANPFKSGETLYYDSKGKAVGKEVRGYGNTRNSSTFYDARGKKTGTSHYSSYTGKTTYYDDKKRELYSGRKNVSVEQRGTYYKESDYQSTYLKNLRNTPGPGKGTPSVYGGRSDQSGCLGVLMFLVLIPFGILMLMR